MRFALCATVHGRSNFFVDDLSVFDQGNGSATVQDPQNLVSSFQHSEPLPSEPKVQAVRYLLEDVAQSEDPRCALSCLEPRRQEF